MLCRLIVLSLQYRRIEELKGRFQKKVQFRTRSLTSACIAHFFSCHNPVTILATVSNEIQTFSRGKNLNKLENRTPRYVVRLTFFPKDSPTNRGSISFRNRYFVSQSFFPLSRCPRKSSVSPPNPSSFPKLLIPPGIEDG